MSGLTPEQRRELAEANVDAASVLRAYGDGDLAAADEVLDHTEDLRKVCYALAEYAKSAIYADCTHRGVDFVDELGNLLLTAIRERDEAEVAARTHNQDGGTPA
mgnify:CR=1 FL=1